jgi:hypothetical protein
MDKRNRGSVCHNSKHSSSSGSSASSSSDDSSSSGVSSSGSRTDCQPGAAPGPSPNIPCSNSCTASCLAAACSKQCGRTITVNITVMCTQAVVEYAVLCSHQCSVRQASIPLPWGPAAAAVAGHHGQALGALQCLTHPSHTLLGISQCSCYACVINNLVSSSSPPPILLPLASLHHRWSVSSATASRQQSCKASLHATAARYWRAPLTWSSACTTWRP